MDGLDRLGEGREGRPGWHSDAGGKHHGRRRGGHWREGTWPTGHGSKNRRHREMEGVLANPPRPRTRPVDAVGTVAAMASGESTRAHVAKALEASK